MKEFFTLSNILFLILGGFWGGSFVAIKMIVDHIPPFFGASLRIGFATLFLTLIYKIFKKPVSVPKNVLIKVWVMGLFMQGFPFALLFWGEKYISPGLAGILNGTVPIWTVLLGSMMLKQDEPLSLQKYIGIILGFLGILIIFFPTPDHAQAQTNLWGALAILLMAICYGIGGILNRKTLSGAQKINRFGSLYQQHLSSFFFLMMFSLLMEWPQLSTVSLSKNIILPLFYLSFFSNTLAWIIYFYLVETWGIVRTSSVNYIAPVAALLTDFIFFRNIPNFLEVSGSLAIFAGIFLIQFSWPLPLKGKRAYLSPS